MSIQSVKKRWPLIKARCCVNRGNVADKTLGLQGTAQPHCFTPGSSVISQPARMSRRARNTPLKAPNKGCMACL